MHSIIVWLQHHLLTCPYKKYFGIACPGCGFQRSLILLLQGNFTASFYQYPPLIPILGLFAFLPLHLIFKFKHGAKILTYWFIADVSIILVSYFFDHVIKMIC